MSAAAQQTDEISVPVAITVFPEEVYRAPETWARRSSRCGRAASGGLAVKARSSPRTSQERGGT